MNVGLLSGNLVTVSINTKKDLIVHIACFVKRDNASAVGKRFPVVSRTNFHEGDGQFAYRADELDAERLRQRRRLL